MTIPNLSSAILLDSKVIYTVNPVQSMTNVPNDEVSASTNAKPSVHESDSTDGVTRVRIEDVLANERDDKVSTDHLDIFSQALLNEGLCPDIQVISEDQPPSANPDAMKRISRGANQPVTKKTVPCIPEVKFNPASMKFHLVMIPAPQVVQDVAMRAMEPKQHPQKRPYPKVATTHQDLRSNNEETNFKRPRGRPRKNPVNEPKRPRGRPRKNPINPNQEQPSSSNQQMVKVAYNQPTTLVANHHGFSHQNQAPVVKPQQVVGANYTITITSAPNADPAWSPRSPIASGYDGEDES